jgi:hypothetical protein
MDVENPYIECADLDLSITHSLVPLEPDDNAVHISGRIVVRGYPEKPDDMGDDLREAGVLRARLVPTNPAETDGLSLFDVLDAEDGDYLEVAGERENLAPAFQEIAEEAILGSHLLIIETVGIGLEFRGHRLGLAAVRRLIDMFGDQCSLVVLKPFPLQYDGQSFSHLECSENEMATAIGRLEIYWGQMGFEKVWGTSLMALNPGLVHPTLAELANPKRILATPKPSERTQRVRHRHRTPSKP